MSSENPCLSCGACCASFRVSFYWGETDSCPQGTVPASLTQRISPHLVAMVGTDQPVPHCIALQGEVGVKVWCGIYQQRPSPCRNFTIAGLDGVANEACDRARQRHGLPGLAFVSGIEFLEEVAIAANQDPYLRRLEDTDKESA